MAKALQQGGMFQGESKERILLSTSKFKGIRFQGYKHVSWVSYRSIDLSKHRVSLKVNVPSSTLSVAKWTVRKPPEILTRLRTTGTEE